MREMRWSWWRIIAGVSSVYDDAGPGAAQSRGAVTHHPASWEITQVEEEHRRIQVRPPKRENKIGGRWVGIFRDEGSSLHSTELI